MRILRKKYYKIIKNSKGHELLSDKETNNFNGLGGEKMKKSIKHKDMPNYIVTTQGWSGRKVTECETVDECWDAIGAASFGSLYEVNSPVGLDVSNFIPF